MLTLFRRKAIITEGDSKSYPLKKYLKTKNRQINEINKKCSKQVVQARANNLAGISIYPLGKCVPLEKVPVRHFTQIKPVRREFQRLS